MKKYFLLWIFYWQRFKIFLAVPGNLQCETTMMHLRSNYSEWVKLTPKGRIWW